MSEEDSRNKKRVAVVGLYSILLVAMVVAVTVEVTRNNKKSTQGVDSSTHKSSGEMSASMKAIKAICQPTDYRSTCEKTLKKSAGNTTDPQQLVQIAFKVAETQINEAAKKSALLQELENDPRTHSALESCKELMNMSINELKQSVRKVSDFDITQMDDVTNDLKTWLSASITYQETCLDGFENTTTNAGEKMKQALKTAMELSSNGLDIVTRLSSVLSSVEISSVSRRLLQNDIPVTHQFPSWVDSRARILLSTPVSHIKADIIVAKDGTGKYKTIQEALQNIPLKRAPNASTPFVIYIKQGVYHEYLEFTRSMNNIVIVGDGPEKTRITGNKNFIDGINTFQTATVAVTCDNFIAKNIGFENSAGAIKHQAVALRVTSDFAVFYNCSMDGYQDTLYTHAKRQFYRDCSISGTIDFVFGDAPVVFQNCTFLIRKPLENQQNIVTAQGRTQRRQPSAIIIQNCTITAHPELALVKDQYKSYLGRPWKEFSRTIVMESYIDDVIHPDGWLPWIGTFGLKTCWYTEFNNYGPGSNKKDRVSWNGIKTITKQHALDFTPGNFLRNDFWIKKTGIPYVRFLTRA